MGLDIAETVIEVEDAFGIEIPEDTDTIFTVGDLIAFVQSQLDEARKTKCYSSFCFYRLREAFCTVSGKEKRSIRPSTPITEILPEKDEAVFFQTVRDALGKWQGLLPKKGLLRQYSPHWVSRICRWLGVASVLLMIFGVIPWWLMLCALFLFFILAGEIDYQANTSPGTLFRKTRFIRRGTVGDVARVMSTRLGPEDMGGEFPLPTEIEIRIKTIISEIINVSIDKIKNTDRFVEDLGMG